MKAIKFSILCFALGAQSYSSTFAQNVEQIFMKSGSVVEGYISEQNPGKYITINTQKAVIVASCDSLASQKTETVPFESLNEEWKTWAQANKKIIESNGQKQLELSQLVFKNSEYNNVYLLEKGAMLKFLDLTPNSYTFKWGDMHRTVKNQRPNNAVSGLKEILVLNDNTQVQGQIIEQFPGENLKIISDEGEVLTFKFDQVVQIKTQQINEKLGLWKQIHLLDKIQLKGQDTPLVGFISSRTLGKEFVMDFEDGTQRTIPQNQVKSYAKMPNPLYVALTDKELKEGEILLNGKVAYFVPLEVQGQNLLLGETVSVQLAVGETACIEAKLTDPNTPITLVKAHLENVVRQNGKKKEEYPWPVITYQDLVQSHVAINREITPLGNVKISFVVKETGDYVLHIQGKKEFIVINVIDKK